MLAYSVFYIYPNFHPAFPPTYLPLTALDFIFPLVPWTFLVYVSDYILVLTAIWLLQDEGFHSFARMAFMTLILCGLFFIFMPTVYPRPTYPAVESSILSTAMSMVAAGDKPTNCFPSMHVAITGIATWSLRNRGTKWMIPFCIWSFAIFVSTLTTKQHYFTDILGGLGVVGIVGVAERIFTESRLFKAWLSRTSSRRVY